MSYPKSQRIIDTDGTEKVIPFPVINGATEGITGLTGGTPANLDGYDAGLYPDNTVMILNVSGIGALWFLIFSSATPGPTVVDAFNKSGYQWLKTL